MRLTEQEIDAIRAAARQAFGPEVVVRLFGSRVDDSQRGGDIDLHFEVPPGAASDDAVERFERLLFSVLDPQKIDKIFSEIGSEPTPFAAIARRDGVLL